MVQTLMLLTGLCLLVAAGFWVAARWSSYHRALAMSSWHREQAELAEQASLTDRVQLARALHDGVANTITTVVVQAAAARSAGGADSAVLHGIEQTARRAMEEMQATLRLLPRGEPEPRRGLAELTDLFATARLAGLDLRTSIRGRPRSLVPAAELAAYRAVQEGITNVLKYTAPGARCRVDLVWTDRQLLVSISDGPGSVPTTRYTTPLPATGGRGLVGLADRIRPLGGWVESDRSAHGFRLSAGLPVRAA